MPPEVPSDLAVPARRNAVESKPSSRSAFRFVTLPVPFVEKGACPAATVSPSAVEPAFLLRFVTCSVFFGAEAVSELCLLALFALPSTNAPPVAE